MRGKASIKSAADVNRPEGKTAAKRQRQNQQVTDLTISVAIALVL